MRKSFSKLKFLIILLIATVSAFLIFRMATAPTDLEVSLTYELPEFVDVTKIVPDYPGVKQAVAIDGETVYTNNTSVQPTASTAKMILALMVMDKKPFKQGEKGETITITPEMYSRYTFYTSSDGSVTEMATGDTLSEYDALATTLLPSSNNMADSLAIWAFGDLETYRTYTTDRLKEWGITETTIGNDASGFSSSTTSTASDLAKIGHKLMQNPVLAEIVGMSSYTVPLAGTIENTNKLLGMDNITGVKTGYIGTESGYCLVVAYLLSDHIITVATLDTDTRAESFAISQNVVEALQQNLLETPVLTAGQEVGYYDSWWTGKVKITAKEDALALGWSSATRDVKLDMEGTTGTLKITIGNSISDHSVQSEPYDQKPSLWQRFLYAIGQYPKN